MPGRCRDAAREAKSKNLWFQTKACKAELDRTDIHVAGTLFGRIIIIIMKLCNIMMYVG